MIGEDPLRLEPPGALVALPRSFYARDPVTVAKELLNTCLLRRTPEGVTGGRVVETEAYLAKADSACHAARGPTPRNRVMYGRPGLLYVYAIHSRFCLNVVTESKGVPSAVLIRAIEPLRGVGLMETRRGTRDLSRLARGPARLCEALSVDRSLDGWDLTKARRIWIEAGSRGAGDLAVGNSSRIGVTSAHDLPLRFFVDGSRYVSGPRHHHHKADSWHR